MRLIVKIGNGMHNVGKISLSRNICGERLLLFFQLSRSVIELFSNVKLGNRNYMRTNAKFELTRITNGNGFRTNKGIMIYKKGREEKKTTITIFLKNVNQNLK